MLKPHPEVEQVLIVTFTTTLLLYSYLLVIGKIFVSLEGEEVMAGEDVKSLQEKITGKLHNYNNYEYCLKIV